jgi:hypothetical protein
MKCCERDYDSDGNCDRHPADDRPRQDGEPQHCACGRPNEGYDAPEPYVCSQCLNPRPRPDNDPGPRFGKQPSQQAPSTPSAGLVQDGERVTYGQSALAPLDAETGTTEITCPECGIPITLGPALDACQQERDLLKRSLAMLCKTEDQ